MSREEQPRSYTRRMASIEARLATVQRALSRAGTGAARVSSGPASVPVPARQVGDDERVWEAAWVDGAAVQVWLDSPAGRVHVEDVDGAWLGTWDGQEQQEVALTGASRTPTALLAAPAARDGLIVVRIVASYPLYPPVVVVSDPGR